MFTYTCCSTSISGTGNITSNPLFVNPDSMDFQLSWENFPIPDSTKSPCIDTGNPGSPLDPDSTRADMGAFYFDQSLPPASVTLTPYNPPIRIPPSGGDFDYNIAVAVIDSMPRTFDVWIMVTLPNGSQFGPVLGPVNLTLPGGASVNRDRTQSVPGSAPTGNYLYTGYVGNYPDDIWDEDGFPFEKLGSSEGSVEGDWSNTGEMLASVRQSQNHHPPEVSFKAYPNPFNLQTCLNFTLPKAGQVMLTIHDVSGRQVEKLQDTWLAAGLHSVKFDGFGLSSGIYVARLYSAQGTLSVKLLIVK